MENAYLGSDIKKLGFGLMRLPAAGGEIDLDQVKAMVDRFMEKGFTYFDTAYVYHGGKSEVAAREALVKRYPRDSFQLATKLPVWEVKQPEDLDRLFQIQLDRTGAGYFDFYLLHALDKGRLEQLDKFDMWRFAIELKAKGLIRHAGFSFHDKAEVLDEILTKHPEMDFVQLQVNYADWEDEDVQSRACYDVARRHGKPVIIMEPVKGGSLAGLTPDAQAIFKAVHPERSMASWALRFCASLEGIVTVLSGMSNMEQMQDNLATFSPFEPLTPVERAAIDSVVRKNAEIPTVPCTACKYCVDDCPQKINIPGAFEAFNNYKVYGNVAGAKGHYNWVMGKGGKASDCIACGACEGHCPQHIAIIDTLKELAGVLE